MIGRTLMISLSAAVFMFQGSQASAQAKLVETVTQKGNEVVIPYEKYLLPNGLTLIIHEDHSDPIVHVDITYHVGSAREEISKSGFAHFFEHMMFQGSDNVPDEAHFKIITEAGGTLNGTTNRDRTNYFQTVPANQLEKMLWLEADRMGFLLDAVTQEKFEIQRATVKNERGQRYDNQPYGLVSEFTVKHLYPYGHPYSWLTIGYIEDLDRVDVNDLKNFFLRWYGPNNAVLTIGGDVDKKQTVAWVEKYFGSIPRGAEVEKMKLELPKLQKDRYVSMYDNYAKQPMLRMVYPTSASYSDDEAALDCLAEILGQGKNSLLYQNLVKTNKAVSANVYNYTSELAGEFTINVTPYPGGKLSDMEKIIRQTFEEFEKRGVSDEDVAKYKSKIEANIIYRLESVSGKVSQLAAYHTFTGNANYIGEHLRKNTSFTKEDVMRAYNKYIKGKYATITSVTTKGNEENKAAEDNYEVVENSSLVRHINYDGLTYNKPKDNFDRSIMPHAGEPVVVKAPDFWRSETDSGIRYIGTQSDEIPVVYLLLSFKGGNLIVPENKTGLASLFASMMNEDTKKYSAEEFAAALEKLGSSISIGAGRDNITVQVRTLSKNIDATIDLLKERLTASVFNQDDFERNKKRNIESLKNALNRPAFVASQVYSKLLYPNSPLGYTTTEESLGNITLQDIEEYNKRYLNKKELEVVIVGDISQNEILPKLSFLELLSSQTVKFPDVLSEVSKENEGKIYFVHIPNAAQTEFRIGRVTRLKYDATGPYFQSTIMNYPLGGAFNSRINIYLREEKGWTYGARSYFSGNKYTGEYGFTAGIKADATQDALNDVLKIINEYKEQGITEEELKFTKNSLTLSEARKYETGFQKAAFLSNILSHNLPANYSQKQNTLLERMTKQRIDKLASDLIPTQKQLTILLVGDKNNLKENREQIIFIDKNGNKQE